MSFASFHSIQCTDGGKDRANWAVVGGGRCSRGGRKLGPSTLLSCHPAIASHRSTPVPWRLCPAASQKLFSIFVSVPWQGCQIEVEVTIGSDTQKWSQKTGQGVSNQTKKDMLRKRLFARRHQEAECGVERCREWKHTAFWCVIVLLCGNLAAEGIRATVKLISAVIILSLTALTFRWELENGRLVETFIIL